MQVMDISTTGIWSGYCEKYDSIIVWAVCTKRLYAYKMTAFIVFHLITLSMSSPF